MSSANTIPVEQEDYLEIDDRIPGQNYVCMSFISPEETLVQAELFKFNKYMLQVCKEFEDSIDEAVKKAGDDYNNKITKELKNKLLASTSIKFFPNLFLKFFLTSLTSPFLRNPWSTNMQYSCFFIAL